MDAPKGITPPDRHSRLHPRRIHRLAIALIAALLAAAYYPLLCQGADMGDTAELQYAAPLAGICHPPGYQTEVSIGWLWCKLLPINTPAWRMNLLQLVCGIIGAIAFHGAVGRITHNPLAAFAAAATLGLSSIYWRHSLAAEVYVFYGAFLLGGLYFTVRLFQEDKTR